MLVFSKPLSSFFFHYSVAVRPALGRETKEDFHCRGDYVLQTAYGNLFRSQERYKRNFDIRVREVNRNIHAVHYTYLDHIDGDSRRQSRTSDIAPNSKLRTIAVGPFWVLRNHVRAFLADQDGVTELVFADRVAYAFSPSQPVPPSATPVSLAAKIRSNSAYTAHRLLDHQLTHDDNNGLLVKRCA